jgi:CubicO group peptidase (beta-lactamase class C family)
MKQIYIFLASISLLFGCSSDYMVAQETTPIVEENAYFPPNNTQEWETKTPESLNWNTSNLNELQQFLEEKNSKSFIILHKGKIVVEYYMNNHTESSLWYWASAGKTLTSTTIGIAQDEGLLDINTKVSDYLGTGWTSASLEKEDLITSKNLLNMTSGLDDTLGNDNSPSNLQYVADAGTRWAYHNVYVKLQDVVAQASNQSWDAYFDTKLKNRIGMNGAWNNFGGLNVYWSNSRSMARFGLLISEHGNWNGSQIISEAFLNDATSLSQPINKAYGYLWWLNGKESYHLPQTQFEFSGELIPYAPDDMYCALGKNDQKIYIVPSKDLVIIRMGQAADDDTFGLSSFDNDLWEKINLVTN